MLENAKNHIGGGGAPQSVFKGETKQKVVAGLKKSFLWEI